MLKAPKLPINMKLHCLHLLAVLLAGYSVLPSASYPAEDDAVVIDAGTDVKALDANTKIFSSNVEVDSAVTAGIVGLGVGVGGVLLAQHFLNKPDCRYKRFDMGGLFGGNKDCNRRPHPHRPGYPPRPRPPYHGGGGYGEPDYDRPYRPSRPYKEPHRPQRPYRPPYRPQRPYEEPYRPQRPYREPYRPSSGYREPSDYSASSYRPPTHSSTYKEPPRLEHHYETPYRKPKPDYEKPAVYRPPSSSHHETSNTYYPPQSPIRGRGLDGEDGKTNFETDDVEDEESNKEDIEATDTGKLLSGRVRFGDK